LPYSTCNKLAKHVSNSSGHTQELKNVRHTKNKTRTFQVPIIATAAASVTNVYRQTRADRDKHNNQLQTDTVGLSSLDINGMTQNVPSPSHEYHIRQKVTDIIRTLNALFYGKTSVSETIRKPPLVKPQTAF